MATKKNITNYSLLRILREFFPAGQNKSYRFSGTRFTNAELMYNWILKQKKAYSRRGERVTINFDPINSLSSSSTTDIPVKNTSRPKKETKQLQPRNKGKSTGEVLYLDKQNRTINETSPSESYYKNAPENDYESLFGDYRVNQVQSAWENPYTREYVMQPFREGSNIAGNAAAITLGGGLALEAGIGAALAGEFGSLTGGLIGSYLGTNAGDKLISYYSNGKYSGFLDWLNKRDTGIYPVTGAMMHPGAVSGGLIGSSIGSTLLANAPQLYTNAYSTFANNSPRIAMTNEGPVMLEPNQTLRLSGRDALPPGQFYGSRWQGQYNPRGYARSGGLTNEGTGSQMAGLRPGKKMSGPSKPESDVSKVRGKRDTYTTTPESFVPYNQYFYPMYVPGVPTTPPPPVTTIPEPEPEPKPVPETRYELITNEPDPFISWFAQLKTGDWAKWDGDPNSIYGPTGWFVVTRTQADPEFETRKVAVGSDNTGRPKGLVARDSTSRRRLPANTKITPVLRELPGAVDSRAILTDENILYKQGGLIKRLY